MSMAGEGGNAVRPRQSGATERNERLGAARGE